MKVSDNDGEPKIVNQNFTEQWESVSLRRQWSVTRLIQTRSKTRIWLS